MRGPGHPLRRRPWGRALRRARAVAPPARLRRGLRAGVSRPRRGVRERVRRRAAPARRRPGRLGRRLCVAGRGQLCGPG
ncbi:MAG: hypothetical protein EP329_06435, partial [Deltaproteobacteria bacterium]